MSTAKKKALIISCMAVILCAAVIAGATYALFTDGEQYAIGVNTGKIDVSAALSMEDAWSESQAGVKENATKGEGEITSLTVPQGGKVSIAEGKTVTFSEMSLGDGAKFSLSFDNKSTVDMQYRVSVSVNAGASKLLRDHLTLKVNDGAAADMFADGQEQTALIDWTAVETGENNAPAALDKLTFEIALPWSALADSETYDEAQSISLTVKMEAIQANADSMPVYVTLEEASASALEEALSAVEEGGTGFITLPEGEISWTDAMSELTANKTLTIAGAGQDKTVISAAAGSGFTQIKLQGTVTVKDLSTKGCTFELSGSVTMENVGITV